MVKFSVLLFTMTVLVSGCSSSQKTTGEKQQEKILNKNSTSNKSDLLECKKGQDARKLEILKSGNGCQLAYTKNGETKNIASAVTGFDYCKTVFQRIQGKLTSSGYTCN